MDVFKVTCWVTRNVSGMVRRKIYSECHISNHKCYLSCVLVVSLVSLLQTDINSTRIEFRAWVRNQIHIKVWDVITHPGPKSHRAKINHQ